MCCEFNLRRYRLLLICLPFPLANRSQTESSKMIVTSRSPEPISRVVTSGSPESISRVAIVLGDSSCQEWLWEEGQQHLLYEQLHMIPSPSPSVFFENNEAWLTPHMAGVHQTHASPDCRPDPDENFVIVRCVRLRLVRLGVGWCVGVFGYFRLSLSHAT